MKNLKKQGKLILNKATISRLNGEQMENISGGGIDRSNRREGDCYYSRHNAGAQGSCVEKGRYNL